MNVYSYFDKPANLAGAVAHRFNLDVVTGDELRALVEAARGLERRSYVDDLVGWLEEDGHHSRVVVINGFRGGCKSTSLLHVIDGLGDDAPDHCALVRADGGHGLWDLTIDLRALNDLGIYIALVDGASLLQGFADHSKSLEIHSMIGELVVTGDDSLAFPLAEAGGLLMSTVDFDATPMFFAEAQRMAGGGVMDYVRRGGAFKAGADGRLRHAFETWEDCDAFIAESVAGNIRRTLELNPGEKEHRPPDQFVAPSQIESAVSFLLQGVTREFVTCAVERLWVEERCPGWLRSEDVRHMLEPEPLPFDVSWRGWTELRGQLRDIGLLRERRERVAYEPHTRYRRTALAIPGLRWGLAMRAVERLVDAAGAGSSGRELLVRAVEEEALREVAALEAHAALRNPEGFRSDEPTFVERPLGQNGEGRPFCIDLRVETASRPTEIDLYQVIPDASEDARHTRWFSDARAMAVTDVMEGGIRGRFVLYTGETHDSELCPGARYVNVEEFLRGMPEVQRRKREALRGMKTDERRDWCPGVFAGRIARGEGLDEAEPTDGEE